MRKSSLGDSAGLQQRSLPGPLVTLRSPVGIAPTQTLGWELSSEPGIEGIKAFSAKAPTTCCLVIFTHKLQRPSSLAWGDPNTGAARELSSHSITRVVWAGDRPRDSECPYAEGHSLASPAEALAEVLGRFLLKDPAYPDTWVI